MRKWIVTATVLVIVASLLVACGGKGGAASVPMETYEGSTFSIRYPSAWEKSTIELMGLSMALFSSRALDASDLQGLDFESLVSTEPLAMVMVVPSDLVDQMGLDDLDAAMSEATEIEEGDVKVLQQGNTTMGGAKGNLVIAKGDVPDLGQVGMHVVAAKRDDGSVVMFAGFTPQTDLDKNLAIFEQMQKDFKFK